MKRLIRRVVALFLLPVAVGVGLALGLLSLLLHPTRLVRLFRRDTWAELRPRDQERKVLVKLLQLALPVLVALALAFLWWGP